MASGSVGSDWCVSFSTIHGARGRGMTRVVFCDPDDPEQCRAEEFFLDGLKVEDLRWEPLSSWTYQGICEAAEDAEQGTLRERYETFKDIYRL